MFADDVSSTKVDFLWQLESYFSMEDPVGKDRSVYDIGGLGFIAPSDKAGGEE